MIPGLKYRGLIMVTVHEKAKRYDRDRLKAKQRQQAFQAEMKAKGYKRLTAFISGEAKELLQAEVKTSDKNQGEILSDLIVKAFTKESSKPAQPAIKKPVDKPVKKAVTVNDSKAYNQDLFDLKLSGLSFQKIVDKLAGQGVPNTSNAKNLNRYFQDHKHTFFLSLIKKHGGQSGTASIIRVMQDYEKTAFKDFDKQLSALTKAQKIELLHGEPGQYTEAEIKQLQALKINKGNKIIYINCQIV